MLVLGTTRRGKTYFANEALHKPAGCFSIALASHIERKAKRDWYGPLCRKPSDVAECWKRYNHHPATNQRHYWGHPVLSPPEPKEKRRQLLHFLWRWIKERTAEKDGDENNIIVQVLGDEGHAYDENGDGALNEMASEGLGIGERLVVVTQFPGRLYRHTRQQLDHQVIFYPGRAGKAFLQGESGLPADEIVKHTRQKHHFVEDIDGELVYRDPI